MTSVLNVDTIVAKNGTDPVALTKQEAAKVTIAGSDAAVLFRSLNVSSGVDEGTGDYKYNLTNALNTTSAENCVSACALGYQTIIRIKTAEASTSVVDIESINTSASQTNAAHGVAIHGDLA